MAGIRADEGPGSLRRDGRVGIGVELKGDYLMLAKRRTQQAGLL